MEVHITTGLARPLLALPLAVAALFWLFVAVESTITSAPGHPRKVQLFVLVMFALSVVALGVVFVVHA